MQNDMPAHRRYSPPPLRYHCHYSHTTLPLNCLLSDPQPRPPLPNTHHTNVFTVKLSNIPLALVPKLPSSQSHLTAPPADRAP